MEDVIRGIRVRGALQQPEWSGLRQGSRVGEALAGTLGLVTGKPVLRAGRVAGQFAEPRSNPTEVVEGIELPVFRGT